MIGFNNDAGHAGGDSPVPQLSGSSNDAFVSRRGRARSNDFGMPVRQGLLDLARTYLEAQARLWPDLAGTAAVPSAEPPTIAAMADDFERRFDSSPRRSSAQPALRSSGSPWRSRICGSATKTPILGRSISNCSTS